MESQDDSSISKISNKDYYRFDNYGNVVADSIEDLLYDKYTTNKNLNKNFDKENENLKVKFYKEIERNSNDINEISLSSSIDEGKKNKKSGKNKNKKPKSKNNTNKKKTNLSDKKKINKSNKSNISNKSNKSNSLNLNDEEKISGTDDKFLETINGNVEEEKDEEKEEEEKEEEEEEEEEDKFINTLEGNETYQLKQAYFENDNYFINNYNNNKNKNNKNNQNNQSNKKIKNEEYNEIEISKDINIQSNTNSNGDDVNNKKVNNINNNNKEEESNNYKKNNNSKENKNILQNRYIDEKSESTKINSKKSGTFKTTNYNKKIEALNEEIKNLKKGKTIRKIHLNSKTEIKNKIKNNLTSKTIGFKEEENKEEKDKKYTIKLNLNESNEIIDNNNIPIPNTNNTNNTNNINNINNTNNTNNTNKILPKKKRVFITKIHNQKIFISKEPLLSVANNYCFYTKQIKKNYFDKKYNEKYKKNYENRKKNNEVKKEEKHKKNEKKENKENKNKKHKKDTDENYDTDTDKNSFFKEHKEKDLEKDKKRIKHKKNEKEQKNETMKEPEMWTELDLDKYHNPKKIRIKINNPLYPFYQYINKDSKKISLNKINKRSRFLDNNIHIQKDINQNIIKLNNKKELGPLKIKRRTKTNSISSVYTTKSDNIGLISDYNYFNNKEIIKALEKKNNKNSEDGFSVKHNKKYYNGLNNKFNVKSFEPGFTRNNYFNDPKYMKYRKYSSEKENKNNYYSYINNNHRNIKNRKLSKNNSNISNSSISSKYANVINIEFPALSSYFH